MTISINDCACGCGNYTTETFSVGHNRRTQGRLLAQLATGEPDTALLAVYLGNLKRLPTYLGYDSTIGYCLCGCGNSTKTVFATGCGIKFGDALLACVAGLPVDIDGGDPGDVLAVWRERQPHSPRSTARTLKYA